jgi:hypothetical protein
MSYLRIFEYARKTMYPQYVIFFAALKEEHSLHMNKFFFVEKRKYFNGKPKYLDE